jgi:hypothetical protein
VVIHKDTKGQTASDAMVRLKTLSSLDSHFWRIRRGEKAEQR